MKFQTLSVLAGTEICNASCPFCVSRMTGMFDIGKKKPEINKRNLKKAYTLAWRSGVNTVIITGKGEPTLYPEHIDGYLDIMEEASTLFPFVELQTNGSRFGSGKNEIDEKHLELWHKDGMTTVMISIVHWLGERNREIYFPEKAKYIDLKSIIKTIQGAGINVRLTCIGVKDLIDSWLRIKELIDFAKDCGVQQLTWRPVSKPEYSEDPGVVKWTENHLISADQQIKIDEEVTKEGKLLRNLPHGAKIWDVDGMNLCLTSCLTHTPDSEDQRQLIFFPDGRLYTDWQYKGSILL